ncbi:MAG TPA: tetratricopeptide repeat protein [Polyangia bacterium]|nr:tetratricopeptide repeat protein [Polyangia bacterium]
MAEREKPKAPVLPFAGENENEWETELADWDAHLPIQDAGAVPATAPDLPGAIPIDENAFAETPTTVVSPPRLDDARVFEAAADEFSERATPHSDAYAAIISTVDSEESPFQGEPPIDPPSPIFADPLAEMAADPWREDLELLVRVPAEIDRDEFTEAEKRATLSLLAAEMEVADTATQQAALTMAAARLSDALGDASAAASLYDDALILQPGSPMALRARLRLAERSGDAPGALETVGLLAEVLDGGERDHYNAIEAEWTLALGGKLDEAGLAALGDGLARALVDAEIALRQSDLRQVAASLEPVASALGPPADVAFTAALARLAEVAGDTTAAARLRARAAAGAGTGGARLGVLMGQLRDAARASPEAAPSLLAELLAVLPPGDFKVACARWVAALARRAGTPERVEEILSDPSLGPPSPSWLRDRIDLATARFGRMGVRGDGVPVELGGAPLSLLLAEARTTWPTAGGRASLDLMAAELALREGDPRRALDIAAAGLEAAPRATPLALIAEEVAARAGAANLPALRLEALALWARFDPARAAYAHSLVVEALESTLAAEPVTGDERVRVALADQVAAAPTASAFWTLAARERAAGRKAAAAEVLARGAEAWGASEIAPALKTLADDLRADRPATWPAPVPGRDKPRRVETAVEESESVLRAHPADPMALALVTLGRGGDAHHLAACFAAAAGALPAGSEGGRLWKLWAAAWLARAGDLDGALEAAFAVVDADGNASWPPARGLAQRLARGQSDPAARARALLRLAAAPGDAGEALRVADAHESLGQVDAAQAIFRELSRGAGSTAADAARALSRLQAAPPTEGSGVAGGAGVAGAAATGGEASSERLSEARARVRAFLSAARTGQAVELAAKLEQAPPHQDEATAPALYLGALLCEQAASAGADAGAAADSTRLLAAAMAWRAAPRPSDRPGLLCAWRAATGSAGDDGVEGAGALLAQIADRLLEADDALDPGGEGADEATGERTGDPRSSATLLVRAAERAAAAGNHELAEQRLRAALERDGACLPALRALRRALCARGAAAEAASACEREAEVLKGKAERIRLLMLAADLAATAVAPARGATSGDSGLTPLVDVSPFRAARAAEPLRRILAADLDPGHLGAFERLRANLAASGDHAGLSPVLAARIAVATNPFEVAALRLARADLLSGPLGDAEGARAELRAVLQKEPQHGKALQRLADLQYEGGAYGEAAELYLKRALVERSPERLREIFLRIGRIYTRHQHDPKRAADAYKRVLQLEADNREALLALADLLIEIGETKNAIAVIERLVELVPEVDKRVPYLIRLGQLYEQAGDLRQAGARFRRAADDAPRNLAALGEMVRHFDRTRDVAGRRMLLDHALLVLRADLHAGKLDLDCLRAIAHVMQWRGRAAATAAGAQLLAALSPDPADRALAEGMAAPRARRLFALTRPDVDERLFPAGLPSGVRNIFRILGEPLAKHFGDLRRYEVSRADKVARGQGPREIIDPLAVEVGLKEIDVYVKPARVAAEPAWLAVEPGDPPALVLGASILALGAAGVRFAGGRAVRLASTHLDIVLRGTLPQTGALIGGVVRQFVTDYRHPEVPPDVMDVGVATASRALSRRLRQEVMPFAIESAGPLDLAALHAAARDGANQVGLLASGSLPSSLAVILATAGRSLTLAHVADSPEALALLDFALSDGYDELSRELEAGPG